MVPLPAVRLQVEFEISSFYHKTAKYAESTPPILAPSDVVHALQAKQIVLMSCFAQGYNLIVSDFLC